MEKIKKYAVPILLTVLYLVLFFTEGEKMFVTDYIYRVFPCKQHITNDGVYPSYGCQLAYAGYAYLILTIILIIVWTYYLVKNRKK